MIRFRKEKQCCAGAGAGDVALKCFPVARCLGRCAVQCIAKLHLHDSGTFFLFGSFRFAVGEKHTELLMNGLIYLIGLIVVIMAVLSLLGLR